jgi:group I intron endonuclease
MDFFTNIVFTFLCYELIVYFMQVFSSFELFIFMNSGIYKITCLKNGRFYVGSTVNLKERWQTHRSRLRKGNHENPYLQNTWNKYGEASFVFQIIENVEESLLFDVEQSYLDALDACNKGFNISTLAHGPQTEKLIKEYIVTLPSGEEVRIKNLMKFCRQHNLGTCGGLHQVARGLINQCNGYKVRYAYQSIDDWKKTLRRSEKHGSGWKGKYKVTFPTGESLIIFSLTDFCKKHMLSQGNMAAICRGERTQHKGYKCEYFTCIQGDTSL